MRIKDMGKEQRPREKAMRMGIDSLSDEELLCLILGSGHASRPVQDIARDLLEKTDQLTGFFGMLSADLLEIDGIGPARALLFAACAELGKRALERQAIRTPVGSPSELVSWLQAKYGSACQECFGVVCLDAKGQILVHKTLFIGTLNRSVVHPREILKTACLCSAASLIAVHNHPSGCAEPSQADLETTKILQRACSSAGIVLLDHLIITSSGYCSFASRGLLTTDDASL